MTDHFKYQGNELEMFQHARHWKKYFSKKIKPFVMDEVLEVGAGMGATTRLLNSRAVGQWLMLEPDSTMAADLQQKVEERKFLPNCRAQKGTLNDVEGTFDTILYIDVLEHIEKDQEEMKNASAHLNPGGHIIVLSPAFQFLFSPFDKAIGHFRRYDKKMMKAITPPGTELVSCRYYDSAGYFASLMNKIFLRKKYPTLAQVKFWDNWLVRVSQLTDALSFHSFGKSIISIWRKK